MSRRRTPSLRLVGKTLDLGSVGAGLGARYRYNELEGEGAVAFSIFCWLRRVYICRACILHTSSAPSQGTRPRFASGTLRAHPEGVSLPANPFNSSPIRPNALRAAPTSDTLMEEIYTHRYTAISQRNTSEGLPLSLLLFSRSIPGHRNRMPPRYPTRLIRPSGNYFPVPAYSLRGIYLGRNTIYSPHAQGNIFWLRRISEDS